jgi:peroxiredoxin
MSKKKKINKSDKKVDKIGFVRKRQTILLAISGLIIIVAIIIYGVISCQNTINGKNNYSPPVANNGTATSPGVSPSTDKIEISGVVVTNIMERSLTVTWKTNIPSTSELLAQEQNSVNAIASWPDNNLVLEHKIVLEGLIPSTTYILEIKSKDASGNQAVFEINNPYQTLSPRFSTEMAIGETSLDFLLKAVTGESVRLSDFKGKWVMIVFWMTSCNGCREELPHLQNFWINSRYNDFILLTINVGGREVIVNNYVKSENLTFPVLLDEEKEVSEKYTVANFPTTFLIAPDGTVNKIKEDPFKNELEIDAFVHSVIQSE